MSVIKRLVFVCIFLFSSYGFSTAATFTLDFVNMPNPTQIESFTIFLQVDNDFAMDTDSLLFGDGVNLGAVPGSFENGRWKFANQNPISSGGILTIDLYNEDVLDDSIDYVTIPNVGTFQTDDGIYTENNLMNGTIFSFDYSIGNVLGVDFYLALDSNANSVSYPLSTSFDGNSATFSSVPIPSSFLLLGAGICALLGISRKK